MAGLGLPFPTEAAAESRFSHMPPDIPAASVPGLPGTMHAGRLVCVCYPECRYNVCLPLTEGEQEAETEGGRGVSDGISLIQYLLIKQNYFL